MQIESLKMYCDVVRLRSFSKAATESNVTQSTVSQAVRQIEKVLGVVLIDRSQRPWKLTPKGRLYYDGCRELTTRYFELEGHVRELHDKMSAILRIACIYSVGLRHMRDFVDRFCVEHPAADIHLEYLHPDRIYEGVRNEEIDIGVVSFPKSDRQIEVIPWQFETMVLACHPDHRLAREKKISLPKLSGEKYVAFDKGLVIRKEVDRFLRDNGVHVETVLEFDNVEAIKRAVEIASGAAILPAPTLEREIRNGSLKAVPLASRELVRPLGIIHRKGKQFYDLTKDLIAALQKERGVGKSTKA